MLTLCVTAVSAATLNANLVVSKVAVTTATPAYATCPSGCSCLLSSVARENGYDACGGQLLACGVDVYQKTMYCYKTPQLTFVPRTLQTLVVVTTTAQSGTCPAGCSCMMESDAKEKFGTYSRCSETPCYTVVTGSATLNAYCFRQGTPPATTTPAPVCPQGCSCLSDATSKERYGTYTRCTDTVCGYETSSLTTAGYQIPKYCVKQGSTTPVCPEGCNCISEAAAKDRYGDYTRCSSDVCGYEQDQTARYCIKQGSTTPACPEGCSCISDATAKAKGGSWSRCSESICGYEQSTATLAAVVQVPKYCMKQQGTTPACPEGCSCLADAQAKEKFGTFTRCSADVCGYDIPANTVAAYQVPKYCVKQGSNSVCPDGCACISDEDAKLKGLTDRCDNSQTPCGYRTAASTANQRIPLYCYKIPATTPVCPQGCTCVTNATGTEKGLTFCGGKVTLCGYNENKVAMHCFAQTPAPVCPQGCVCTTDEIAKLKGLTPCRGQRTSCGYSGDKQPQYCFEQVPSPTCVYDYQKNGCTGTCPDGYTCGVLASRKDESGKVEYAVCGCTGQPAGQCVFDKEKQVCTGACQNGASCAIVGKKVDDKTGEVMVNCGCPQPPSGQCAYDKEKKACTGACQNGAACTVTGTKKDDAGNEYVFCGCPQQSSCVYDYSREACTGTCPLTGDNCQLNTIYHDPKSGKVTYAECHCKGSSGTPDTCAFNADNYCVGSCAQGGQCANTSVVDPTGKQTFVCTCAGGGSNCALTANNECSGTCANNAPCLKMVSTDNSGQNKAYCACQGITPGAPAVPVGPTGGQTGILDGFFRFFNQLFGGK
jgi:hypothetical protein